MMPLLKIDDVTKHFGNIIALQQFSMGIDAGEVVGLAERNGSGKSAIINMLAGTISPDSGKIFVNGRYLQRPFRALKHGIGLIHSEPILAEQLDITSNIFLGHEICYPIGWKWLPIPNQRQMEKEAKRLLNSLDARLPALHEKVANLTLEERQLVAIAQVMARSTQLIIIDNPEETLSLPYQEKVLDLIRSWQREETAVFFSSNNLDHLFAVADRIVVLRDGQRKANVRTDETTREEIVAALVGTADRKQRTPVIWALDSYYRARKQAETLKHHQLLLEKNLAAQDNLNRQLVNQLADQVKALDSANLALQDAQRRLLTEREQERKHLARELHDQLIQDLLSVNYQIEEIEEQSIHPDNLHQELLDVRHNIRRMVQELRQICGNLRPPTIDSFGLGAALQSFTRQWSKRTGIEVHLNLDSNFGRLPETIELSIFRIVQEGLNNIWKHADAVDVVVTLQHTSPRLLLVSIADDGIGLKKSFDLSKLSSTGHYGLLGISERVALMGGRLSYQNQSKGGLLLQVEIPHPRMLNNN